MTTQAELQASVDSLAAEVERTVAELVRVRSTRDALAEALRRVLAWHNKDENDPLYVSLVEGYEGEELRTTAQYIEDVVWEQARAALARGGVE